MLVTVKQPLQVDLGAKQKSAKTKKTANGSGAAPKPAPGNKGKATASSKVRLEACSKHIPYCTHEQMTSLLLDGCCKPRVSSTALATATCKQSSSSQYTTHS